MTAELNDIAARFILRREGDDWSSADEAELKAWLHESARHQAMGQVYAARRSSTPQQGRQHCEAIAKQFQAIAGEYEELAKLHDELSKNPQ